MAESAKEIEVERTLIIDIYLCNAYALLWQHILFIYLILVHQRTALHWNKTVAVIVRK